jgi:DNA-damage-inducible protein D
LILKQKSDNIMEQNDTVILFEEQKIRREWHDNDWYYALIDVISILTSSADPQQYLKRMRSRDSELNTYIGTNCTYVAFKGETGKTRKYLAANTEGVLRLIMSVPSPKAEPFRQWLAQAGREKIEDMQDPEIGIERIREIYKIKGYTEEWIDRRMQSIEIRKQLTEEWQKRDVNDHKEYAILTAEIAKSTFGLTPAEHKSLKGLDKQNLRDHMTPLELIFTALGEEVTRTLAIQDDAQGFNENYDAAQQGGALAGKALKNIEEDKRIKVVSKENYLKQIEHAEKGLPPVGSDSSEPNP